MWGWGGEGVKSRISIHLRKIISPRDFWSKTISKIINTDSDFRWNPWYWALLGKADLSPLILPVAPWNISYCLHQTASQAGMVIKWCHWDLTNSATLWTVPSRGSSVHFQANFQTKDHRLHDLQTPLLPISPILFVFAIAWYTFFVPISTPPPTQQARNYSPQLCLIQIAPM